MFRYLTILTIFTLLLSGDALGQESPLATAADGGILNRLDAAWGEGEQTRIILDTQIVSEGRSPIERSLELIDDGESRTLVTFLDGPQTGQKVLATDKEVWFFAPRTRRAIRLSASQRLFGQAAIGDVARLRLSKDYEVNSSRLIDADETVLELSALGKSATYQTVLLTIETHTEKPLRASYKTASGKEIKYAVFEEVESIDGGYRRTVTRIEDAVNTGNYTRIRIVNTEPIRRPPTFWTRRSMEIGR